MGEDHVYTKDQRLLAFSGSHPLNSNRLRFNIAPDLMNQAKDYLNRTMFVILLARVSVLECKKKKKMYLLMFQLCLFDPKVVVAQFCAVPLTLNANLGWPAVGMLIYVILYLSYLCFFVSTF
ncbi:hypothetical protein RchiOBHm_Chr6g0275821 [Rosa chinensis]|uniref:Uncharacterized protein n=1 Tax=Rosa chinensis TaxID=74649 RepID=A0A2P6PS60_ROSCH|nr:hypothetical protein RchiOBHm_Chr6g0275821 [Rosa chinensis]